MSYSSRISHFQKQVAGKNAAVILCSAADIRYLTGFVCLNPDEREAFVVVTQHTCTLLYPTFSPVDKIKDIEYHAGYWPEDLKKVIEGLIESEKISEVRIDASSFFLSEYQVLQLIENISFGNFDRTALNLQRAKKDKGELAAVRQASSIAVAAWQYALRSLKAGTTELELAKTLEVKMLQLGADSVAFPLVVAFGEHSALPHHQPTDTKLRSQSVVLLDIGAKYQGYCSDMTRTIWFGDSPSEKFLEVQAVVKNAYATALEAIAPECATQDIDQAARSVIDKAGYGTNFIHTTGHGVGLEIHEQPSLYFKKPGILPAHAVITVEPGIYLPKEFGYRYENSIEVTAAGFEELTA